MKQEKYSNINTEAFDFKYIYRSLKKYLIYIRAVTCVTGTLSYIFLDQYMQNTYKASVNLYVIPRDNSANKFYTTGMDTAVSRCNSALNSDMMKELIKKEDDADKMQGNLSASIVTGTNVIVMSATSSSAESACRLLKAGIDNYPKLSGYFQTGYILKKIGSFSGNGIRRPINMPLFEALSYLFSFVPEKIDYTWASRLILDIESVKEEFDGSRYFSGNIDSTTSVSFRFDRMDKIINRIQL